MKLVDIRTRELPVGTLLFPSRVARESPTGGNYYCTERQRFVKDFEVFPAILLDPQRGVVTTPTGIHILGTTATVSVIR